MGILLRHPTQVGEEFQVPLVGRDLGLRESPILEERAGRQGGSQRHAKGGQRLVEVFTDLLVDVGGMPRLVVRVPWHQHLPVLLDVTSVAHAGEDRPERLVKRRQLLVFGADICVEAFDVFDVEPALGLIGQSLVLGERRIQLLQDAAIVDQKPEFLMFMQAVHPSDRLD